MKKLMFLIIVVVLMFGCNDEETDCSTPPSVLGNGAKLIADSCVSYCDGTYHECKYQLDDCTITADCDDNLDNPAWNEDNRTCSY